MMTWTIYDDYTAVIGALACGTYSFTTTVMFSGTSLLTDILELENSLLF
jgi:hypothetical protein